ncbi:MAG TPA: zinc-binding dehydrogenase [Haliscomenobacter sp.]|nr:zinc-binding dehydrogenase [Haliscomenobacter sp.]
MTNKFKQVLISAYGAPEVLTLVEADVPQPKSGEVIIQTEAIGVNYSDTLRRRNQYFMPTPLPYVLGSEVVGEIIAVGEGVGAPYTVGARVLAILPYGGGYAECVTAQAQYCIPIPPHLDAKAATAIFVQGSTAQLMISQLAKDLKGKSVLVNAAAGGVGSLLVQLAKMGGAKVFAASSSDQKLEVAKVNGADVLINYSKPNWGIELKNLNDGKGVDLAFEMVGGEVYDETVKSLAPGGQLIIYGCASGIQGTVHPEYFVDENLSQIGFNLAHFITHQTAVWQEALGAVIGMVANGQLHISTPHTFLLRDAAEAHRQIESRKTTGKVVLTTK